MLYHRETIKGSDIVAETLEHLGITHAFGIIGAGNVHLFESIATRGYTKIICVHHEQAATMAMQTYYRTSGKIAACLLTTGAGSTNGVTGVVSAWADSIPGLVIAGNENSKFTVSSNHKRMWGVQGYDSVDMVFNVTKYSTRVLAGKDIAFELEKAAHISLDARPGPVWIEIPMDIQSSFAIKSECLHFSPLNIHLHENEYFSPKSQAELLEKQLEKVVDSLLKSQRPILWLGHGIRLAGATELITELLDVLKVPSLVSWAGIDMVDSDHALVYGRAGVYGQRCANFILQNSDYVLAIGTRLAIPQVGYNLTELARAAEIDVVDIDPSEALKYQTRTRESIVCDAKVFIEKLLLKFQDKLLNKNEWIQRCDSYRRQFPWIDTEHADVDGFMNSYKFMERLNGFLKPDQLIVTDMGTALLCGHQVLRLKPGQRLMTSTGLGEMGFGITGAIGASIADNNREVMCLNCDGGMMLNLQELQTIVHHNLPIKIFIFNNDGYLMIKHTQNSLFEKSTVGVDKKSGVSCPNFAKIAFAFDMPSFQIKTWQECDEVLKQVQEINGPVICEVFMHPTQLFSPKLKPFMKEDGTLVSPPLEDLNPFLPRKVLAEAMIIGMHEKSQGPV